MENSSSQMGNQEVEKERCKWGIAGFTSDEITLKVRNKMEIETSIYIPWWNSDWEMICESLRTEHKIKFFCCEQSFGICTQNDPIFSYNFNHQTTYFFLQVNRFKVPIRPQPNSPLKVFHSFDKVGVEKKEKQFKKYILILFLFPEAKWCYQNTKLTNIYRRPLSTFFSPPSFNVDDRVNGAESYGNVKAMFWILKS